MQLHAIRATLGTIALGTLLVTAPGWAQQQAAPNQPGSDNTKMNQRDGQPGQPTADQQKENSSDRDLAKQVRQSFVHDKSLSTYAHNVKVIAEGGKVTLKGPVRSEEEAKALTSKAAEIAGASNVNNELTVAPKQP
jgi:osmotically-inducible protein OsmY